MILLKSVNTVITQNSLRYIDLNECINFVLNINTNKYYKSDKYSIENNFDSLIRLQCQILNYII